MRSRQDRLSKLGKDFAGYEQEYQLDSRGKKRRVLVYRGKYYRFTLSEEELKAKRRRCGIFAGVSVGLYLLLVTLLPTMVVKNPLVAALELAALFPGLYLVLGLVQFCRAKAPFEEKVPLLSVQRLRRSGTGFLIVVAAALVVCICYLIALRPPLSKLLNDGVFLLGLAAVLVLQIFLRRELRGIDWVETPKGSAQESKD